MRSHSHLLLLVLAVSCGGSSSSDGPTFYPDDATKLWSHPIGPNGVGKSSHVTTPAIGGDGTIYVGGADPAAPAPPIACLYAFGPDGNLKQKLCGSEGDHRGAPTIWVTPTPSGDGAFAVDEAGGMYAMRADGNNVHQMLPGASWGPDPVLMGPIAINADGHVLAGGGGAMYVLDVEDTLDPVKWSMGDRETGGSGRYAHIYSGLGPDGRMYASGRKLRGYSRIGSLMWEANTGGGTEGGPVFGYEGSFIVRMHRGLTALSPDGKELWEFDPGQPVLGAPRLDRYGNAYFSTTRSLFSINQVGALKWEFPHNRDFTGAVVVRRDTLYVTDVTGQILAVDMDGQQKWSLDVGSFAATPAVDDYGTMLYVAADDARLYALVPPSS